MTMILSSDSHVIEPPNLWVDRIESRFRDRAPMVKREGEFDYWYIDGHRSNSFHGGTQPGERFDNPENLSVGAKFEEVRPGGYIPEEHLKDNESDGVWGSVLYPNEGLVTYAIPDGELLSAICRVYNDWLAEFCSVNPRRLKGIAMINVDDVEEAVKELKRSRNLGLVGAMITVYPPEDRPYSRPEYDPLWATAQDLDMPLSLHTATNRRNAMQNSGIGEFPLYSDIDISVRLASMNHWVKMSLGAIILSGVFDRYPSLKIVNVEHQLAWLPYFINLLNYTYTQRSSGVNLPRFRNEMLPSDFFTLNILHSFQEDSLGVRDRHIIGIDTLMWASDYPHQESTFPKSQEIINTILNGVSQDERDKILCYNTARLYGFDLNLIDDFK